MNKIAMIPAAGRGSRMLSLTDNNPKAMLPLDKKPIIGHQLDFMIKNNFDKVVIVVGYQKEKLINYVSENYANKIKITFVEQKELKGLADAVLVGLDGLTENELISSKLLISLGDIVPNFDYNNIYEKDRSFVMYNIVEDYKRWCLIELDDKNNVSNFIDKPKRKPKTKDFKNLIGIYQFDDIITLKDCLEDVISENIKINGEFQLSQALGKYSNFIEIAGVNVGSNLYYDLGEVGDLNKTRENIARHFNNVKLVNGVIEKSSKDNFAKLLKEASWYDVLPKKLEKYTPELLEVDIENKNYKLEYIKSTPLQELFLYDLPDMKDWKKIFKQIQDYLDLTIIISEDSDSVLSKSNYIMLIEKTNNRVMSVLQLFNENYYTINGKIYKNPAKNLEKIFKYVEEHFIKNKNGISSNYAYLHGDLFFGNMLYDIEKEELKLVDPRGDYGTLINKGDIRYDIAKLNHSINGYYDFIVNGLYRLENNGTILNYEFYESSQDDVKKLFSQLLSTSLFDEEEINLLTGLLFLTMIPLHSESLENQTMQFIKACEFLSDFI